MQSKRLPCSQSTGVFSWSLLSSADLFSAIYVEVEAMPGRQHNFGSRVLSSFLVDICGVSYEVMWTGLHANHTDVRVYGRLSTITDADYQRVVDNWCSSPWLQDGNRQTSTEKNWIWILTTWKTTDRYLTYHVCPNYWKRLFFANFKITWNRSSTALFSQHIGQDTVRRQLSPVSSVTY